jgi:methyltransferase (TIGR00027 family)
MGLQHDQLSFVGLEDHAMQQEPHARTDRVIRQMAVTILKQVRRLPEPVGAAVVKVKLHARQRLSRLQLIMLAQHLRDPNVIEAVVNLGAGFDTRPYRLPVLSGLPVWEVDQFGNVEAKERRLRKVLGTIPANITLVPAGFDRDDLGSILAAQGYSADKPTFFVWEAVTQYLTEQGVRGTFDWLAKAAPGSRLAFTYVRRDFLDGKTFYGWESGYRQFVASKVWLFGMEPEGCPTFLKDYGWRIIEDVGYDELADKYILPTGRRLVSTPVERMVYAERA